MTERQGAPCRSSVSEFAQSCQQGSRTSCAVPGSRQEKRVYPSHPPPILLALWVLKESLQGLVLRVFSRFWSLSTDAKSAGTRRVVSAG